MGLIYALGVDPGVTTGWAVIGVPRASIFGNAPGRIARYECGEFTGGEIDMVTSICHKARYNFPVAIICEDFDLRKLNRSKDYTSPISVRSKLEMAIDMDMAGPEEAAIGPFLQMPGFALSTATDERLRAWGLYKPGSEHARDATRHAVTFIRRAKDSPRLRESAWPGDYENRAATRPSWTVRGGDDELRRQSVRGGPSRKRGH